MEPNISYWQLEKEYYAVSVTPDLAIRIIEHELITRAEGNGSITENIPYKVHEFKVSGAVLAFASAMLNGLLARSPPNITTVDVHEKDGSGMIQGLKFWFELLHGLFNDDMQSLKLIDVWNVIATAHKYGFNTRGQAAKNWFDGWYKAQFQINKFGFKEYEQLLYPTYVFDHAYGFAQTTKNLCYRAHGTINQKQPASFDVGNKRDLYLDENVLIQLNSAKGRLQIILHRALYAPIDTLLKSGKCACKANALYAYESSLNSTHVWPMESKMHNTGINSIIKSLDTFQPSKTFQPQTCGSKVCTIDCKDVILTASQDCKKYFDGMCLGTFQ